MSEDRGHPAAPGEDDADHARSGRGIRPTERDRAIFNAVASTCGIVAVALAVTSIYFRNPAEVIIVAVGGVAVGLVLIFVASRILKLLNRRVVFTAVAMMAVVAVTGAFSYFLGADRPSAPPVSPPTQSQGTPTPPSSSQPPPPGSPPVSLSAAPGNDVVAAPATFSADGRLAAGGGSTDATATDVYAWNTRTRAYLGEVKLGGSFSLAAMAFTPDDRSLMVLDASGQVCQWKLTGSTCTVVFEAPAWDTGGTWNAAISGDASTVAVQDQSGKGVNVVSIASGELIGHFTDPDGAGLMGWNYAGNNSLGAAVSLDENGRVVTVGDEQGNLYVWDVATGKRLASLRFDVASAVKSLTPAAILSPDGTRVVLPYAPNGLRSTLWDVSTKANITPHYSTWPTTWDAGAASVFFSPDSPNIVTYRDGGTAADVWDSALEHIGTVSFPSGYTGDEVFAASASYLLADDGSHHIFLWQVPGGPDS
jgi:WD40 repeat protein